MARLLLVGYGRMGRLVESLAQPYGFAVAGVVHRANADAPWPDADVAIDFSSGAAVPDTVRRLADRGTAVVIGTTGWHDQEAGVRAVAARAGLGVVAAPNCAVGVNLFLELVERAGLLMRSQADFGCWIHELHHATKKDAPSGTARAMVGALRNGGFDAPVDVASTRAGSIPGTHTIGFDAVSETITLTHQARDRAAFARGALEAARWLEGRRGWFTMRDVLGLT
jgi:4-hydroxy-tetrahydrodipicolinate reductase